MIIPFMSFSRKFIGHKSILVKMRYQGVLIVNIQSQEGKE